MKNPETSTPIERSSRSSHPLRRVLAVSGLSLGLAALPAMTAVAAPAAEARDETPGRQAERQARLDRIQQDLDTMEVVDDPAWAGAVVDTANPTGGVVVRMKGGDGVRRARGDRGLAKLVNAGEARVVAARFSYAELMAEMTRLAPELRAALGVTDEMAAAPFELSVATAANQLELRLGSLSEAESAAVDAVLAETPAGVVRRSSEVVGEVRTMACAPTGCFSPEPFRGGLALNTISSGNCSSGFTVRHGAYPWIRYTTTAGHCPAGVTYYHGIQPLGPMTLRVYVPDASVDAALVPLGGRSSSNLVWRPENEDTPVTAKVTDPSAALVGNTLCKTGQTTNTTCGTLRAVYATGLGTGVNWGLVDAKVCEGDSGGAVFNAVTNRAYGLVSFTRATYRDGAGRWCGTSGTGFTWVPRYEYAFGASGWPYQTLLTP